MNRTNLKILGLICGVASVLIWGAGYLLHGQPSKQERSDAEAIHEIYIGSGYVMLSNLASNCLVMMKDNSDPVGQRDWAKLYLKISDDQLKLTQPSYDRLNQHQIERKTRRAVFNSVALKCLIAAAITTLALFITAPKKE